MKWGVVYQCGPGRPAHHKGTTFGTEPPSCYFEREENTSVAQDDTHGKNSAAPRTTTGIRSVASRPVRARCSDGQSSPNLIGRRVAFPPRRNVTPRSCGRRLLLRRFPVSCEPVDFLPVPLGFGAVAGIDNAREDAGGADEQVVAGAVVPGSRTGRTARRV